MPIVKEPHHFGSDVRSPLTLESREAYLKLFAGAGAARAIGEASIWYLRSRDAAQEIAAFARDARIIAMIREPVSQMRSLHSHNRSRGVEEIRDFARAIDAGTDRFRGRLTGEPTIPEFLDYRTVPLYADQIQRYRDAFPSERILVIIQEEFGRDTPGSFARVLRFLGVDETFTPSFERYGVARRSRLPWLSRWLNAPPAPLRRSAKRYLSPTVRKRLHQAVRRPLFLATTVAERPAEVDPAVLAELRAGFAPEVRRLAAMLERPDLPALWGY